MLLLPLLLLLRLTTLLHGLAHLDRARNHVIFISDHWWKSDVVSVFGRAEANGACGTFMLNGWFQNTFDWILLNVSARLFAFKYSWLLLFHLASECLSHYELSKVLTAKNIIAHFNWQIIVIHIDVWKLNQHHLVVDLYAFLRINYIWFLIKFRHKRNVLETTNKFFVFHCWKFAIRRTDNYFSFVIFWESTFEVWIISSFVRDQLTV